MILLIAVIAILAVTGVAFLWWAARHATSKLRGLRDYERAEHVPHFEPDSRPHGGIYGSMI